MRITEVQGYSISHLVNNPFSAAWSDDNNMALITDKGVHILALAPNPRSTLASLSCSRHSIKTDTSLPTSDVGIDVGELIWHLEKEDAYNLVFDTTLAPKLSRAAPLIPCVKHVAWSALGILDDQRCLLTTLTDMGGLALYKLVNMEWMKQTSISEMWVEHCQTLWRDETNVSLKEQVTELERRASQVKITAMCWSRRVYNSASLFFTGTRSGEVIIWRVSSNTRHNIRVKLLHKFKTDMEIIVALHWYSLSENAGLLLIGNFEGILKCYKLISLENNTQFTIEEMHTLWPEADKMKTNYINCWEYNAGLMLTVAKEAFVLVFYLEYSGKLICHAAYRCCDTTVSGLTRVSDSVLMTTRSGRFTHLSLNLINNKLKLVAKCVENYVNLSHMACYGVCTSNNKAVCGVVLSANQVFDHLILREPSQIILCTLPELIDPLDIVQSSNQPLRRIWDCLEVLRVQTIQKTFVPVIESRRSILDTLNIENITLLLWFITFTLSAEEDEVKIAELQSLRMEVEILVLSFHLFKRVANLLSQESKLSDFQLHTLCLMKKWLKYLTVLDAEYSATLMTASSLLEQVEALGSVVPSVELCSICKTEVPELKDHYYSVCHKGHKLPRCSLSLIQCIEVPYYICSQCGVLAHSLSVRECGYACVFCDGVLRKDEEILLLPDDDTPNM